MNQKGLNLKELIIFTALLLLIIVLGILLLRSERARVRDSRRIADMNRLRYGFEVLFNEENSYAQAAEGCDQENSLVSTCNLTQYLPSISSIKDPGKYSYQVKSVPDKENYVIKFTLEKDYKGLAAGQHILDANGIH